MDDQALTLAELLDQAAAASRLGDREEAERLYRRATERSPANTTAWLGLAGAVESPEEKQACFEKVLEINPTNGEARIALQRMAQQANGGQTSAALAGAPTSSSAAGAHNHRHMPVDTGEVLYCVNHPDTETTLRCNRCGRPVCVRCVELTEVGYRCKDCIREQQGIYFNAVNTDYIVVALVSFAMAAVAAPIIGYVLRFFGIFGWILAFFLGPTVGGAAVTVIRRSIGRRRGRYLGVVAVVAIILGTLLGILVGLGFGLAPNLLALGIFAFLALSTIYATLR